jgi:hypothetical protein
MSDDPILTAIKERVMDRFAIIDVKSGFVCGVTDATDPADACKRIDHDAGEYGREYETFSPLSAALSLEGHSGYLVHRVDADFDVADGQDADAIAAVQAFPRVAIVLVRA